ncbi:MAG TPA: hypothetical protein VFU89_02015 [Rhabdochlamydiaceae bacterium]|nr:hypothetical protein [Rhabdochlamydiaceae bacterium]
MTTSSSNNISGNRLESLPPLQNFSKIVPISIALIILGGVGLWVASQGVKTWRARKASTQASATSFALTIRRLLFERLSNLWNARKRPPPQDSSSSLNIQGEFSQEENLLSKKTTPSALDATASSHESKDQLEKSLDLTPSAQQPLTSSSDLTSSPHAELPVSTLSVSTPVAPSSISIEPFPLKPIAVSPPIAPMPKTTYEVPFYLTTIDGGYIGDPSKFVKAYPKFLDLKMEDGSLLPLDPHDFLVPISVFYESCPPDVARFPDPFYVPYNFLKDKQDEGTFTLKYKDSTFLCTVNQYAHHDTRMNHPFKKILSLITTYVQRNHQIENPLYGSAYDPTWFYQLGNQGSIFKINHSHSKLEERPSTEFRTKNNPIFARGTVRLQNGQCTFTCLMSLINPENVDIILNDTFLMLYARAKVSSWSSQIPSGALVHENLNPHFCLNEREWIFGISWDERPEFNQFELVQLKEKILQGTIRCQSGGLIFSFPLLESSPDKILFETTIRK